MKFAIAKFEKTIHNNFFGCVRFSQKTKNDPVFVEYNISEKTWPSSYYNTRTLRGLHIHNKYLNEEDILNNNCAKACVHFNSGKTIFSETNWGGTKHGQHTGDLKFNAVFENGICQELFFDNKISLYSTEKNCILNRSLVLHDKRDDCGLGGNLESLKTGNAGGRLACANIKETYEVNILEKEYDYFKSIKEQEPENQYGICTIY